ncbi:MAG TPA: RtcB family protein [Solirubrobacteraceae bacterium]
MTDIRIFGDHDEKTIAQLERCVTAEEGARGVLCADGHLGYSQPIGGVVAYREHVSPSGAGYDIGCIAARTPVTSEDGWCAPIETARRADPLTCWDGEGLRPIDPCLGAVARGRRRVVRVTLAGGREVVATPDHELRTKLGWRRADELRPAEAVACTPFIGLPYEQPPSGAPGPALLRVAAYVAGDGHLHASGKVVSIYTSVPEDVVALRDDVLSLGFDATIDTRERGGNVRTQYVVRTSSVAFHRMLRELGIPAGRKALTWSATALGWVLDLPAWMRAHFLSAFASAEATTPSLVDGRIVNVAIKQAGIEPHAIDFVARLAESLGFRTGTSLSGPAYAGVRTWVVHILGGEAEQLRFHREVGFCRAIEKRRAAAAVLSVAAQRAEIVRRRVDAIEEGRARVAAGAPVRDAVATTSDEFGVPPSLVQHGLYGRGAPRVPKWFRAPPDFSNEIAWLAVRSVELAGTADVYDVATRDGAQSFVANGIVVHNCGNKAVRTPLLADELRPDLPRVMDEIVGRISFGVGRSAGVKADHAILDEIRATDFSLQRKLYDLASDQLGAVGAGNHFACLFEDENGFVWVGVHFGSRGFGHRTASHFFGDKGGMEAPPTLLHDKTDLGQQYIQAMDLAARYAFAGRDVVVDAILEILGTRPVDEVHNNHNQIWRETHDGEDWWVVRKGATPAFPGQRGFVGATMGEPSVIVEGTEQARGALYSTIHGAGRAMSRNAAAGKPRKRWRNNVRDDETLYKTREEALAVPGATKARSVRVREGGAIDYVQVRDELRRKGIELRGGGADEAPGAYKRLPDVLKAHEGTIRVLHTLTPIGVAMARPDTFDPYKD